MRLRLDSLEQLIHLQLRQWGPCSYPTSGVWEHQELQKNHITFSKFLNRLETPGSVAQLPVHTNSLHHRHLTKGW